MRNLFFGKTMTKGITGFFMLVCVSIVMMSFSDDGFLQRLKDNYKKYREDYKGYKLFVRFDQPCYTAGDTVFFSASYLQADNTAVPGRQLINIFIANAAGEPVVKKKIASNNGIGTGYIVLPAPIEGGDYRFLAYTNVMTHGKASDFESRLLVLSPSVNRRIVNDNEKHFLEVGRDGDVAKVRVNATDVESYLVAHNNSSITFSSQVSPSGGEFEIPLRSVAGESSIVLLKSDGSVLDQFFYHDQHNPFAIKISSPESVNIRQNITVKISAEDSLTHQPITGKFSVRVIKEDVFKGVNMHSSFFPANGDALPLASVDWKKIVSNEIPSAIKAEKYLRISGQAFLEGGSPAPDSTRVMFFFTREVTGYDAYVMNGRFSIPIPYDFYGDETVFYASSIRGRDATEVRIKLDDEFTPHLLPLTTTSSSSAVAPYMSYALEKATIEKAYAFRKNQSAPTESNDPNFLIEDELGSADITLNIQDFVMFPTMVEIVRELLRAVEYRKYGNKEVFRVYTTHKRPVTGAGPIFVIDGVLTKDIHSFLDINPTDLISIKVVRDGNKLRRLGPLFDNGAILVKTKYSSAPVVTSVHTFNMVGLSRPAERSMIAHKPLNVFDLRARLYWDANVNLNEVGEAEVSFTSSNDVGKYVIQISGITSNGKVFNAESSFLVQFSK
jgi:hypothetical protein